MHANERRPMLELALAVGLFTLAFVAQLPLALNPGYFSHDELQWAVYAETVRSVSWSAIDVFQYRPLTFNLWMWLSRHLFAHPQAFHALLVAWGALNAVLLQRVLRAGGVGKGPAMGAAFVFALSPYAVYVHGWVGTIGDQVWVSCALLVALVALRCGRSWVVVAATLLLTCVALLAKEAAVSIPALALVAVLFDPGQRRWLLVLLAALAPVLLYLGLRIDVLLDATQQGTAYDWSLASIPRRWLEYQLFPPDVGVIEVFNTLSQGFAQVRTLVAAGLWLVLVGVLAWAGWRWAAAFVLGGVAALGPVLILGASSNQYGYGLAAFGCGLVAAAWPRLPRPGQVFVAVYALLLLWHGVNVMRAVREVGEVQAVYSPALAEAVRNATAAAPVRLSFAPGSKEWMFQRLSHEIPSYQGVPIGNRVRLVAPGEPAEHVIQADGRLLPSR